VAVHAHREQLSRYWFSKQVHEFDLKKQTKRGRAGEDPKLQSQCFQLTESS
jgi:hypothetical protein